MTDQWEDDGGLSVFTYVIQVKGETGIWWVIQNNLTMESGAETIERFRQESPGAEFRLIPTDWIDYDDPS
jgi:hypothetical protein